MRVAFVHDWLTGLRGGEKALDALCDVFPGADLFTLVYVPGSTSPRIERRRIVRKGPGFFSDFAKNLATENLPR